MEKLIHLLIPRESNNHKAKILHSSSLIIIASFFIVFQGLINFLPFVKPNILGYAAQISPDEVIRLTNQKRAEAGLAPLAFNQTLANAAYSKGRDMIDKDYWAHVAPDGTQPWKFFNQFGYRYRYAGENLARDFSNANSVVEAWMNSQSHKENMLNPNYKEIGIGVTEGDLAGIDTTIIVQFFGTNYVDQVPQKSAEVPKVEVEKALEVSEVPQIARVLQVESSQQTMLSPFTTSKNVSLVIGGLLLLIFTVDAILVSQKRVARIAGRTFAHAVFLMTVLAIVLVLKSGKIL